MWKEESATLSSMSMHKIAHLFLHSFKKMLQTRTSIYEYLDTIGWKALATNNYIRIKSFVSFRMFIKYANESDKFASDTPNDRRADVQFFSTVADLSYSRRNKQICR